MNSTELELLEEIEGLLDARKRLEGEADGDSSSEEEGNDDEAILRVATELLTTSPSRRPQAAHTTPTLIPRSPRTAHEIVQHVRLSKRTLVLLSVFAFVLVPTLSFAMGTMLFIAYEAQRDHRTAFAEASALTAELAPNWASRRMGMLDGAAGNRPATGDGSVASAAVATRTPAKLPSLTPAPTPVSGLRQAAMVATRWDADAAAALARSQEQSRIVTDGSSRTRR